MLAELADAGVRCAVRRPRPGVAWLGVLLRLPDLLRLLRLLGHGHRARAHARLRVPGELQLPVHLASYHRVLAALAHLAVELDARLPLRPARRQPRRPRRAYANLWIVFLLSGLWHGAAWNFVVWGAFHGLFLSWTGCSRSTASPACSRGCSGTCTCSLSGFSHPVVVLPNADAGAGIRVHESPSSGSARLPPPTGPYSSRASSWTANGPGSDRSPALLASPPPLSPPGRRKTGPRRCASEWAAAGLPPRTWLPRMALCAAGRLAILLLALMKVASVTYNPFIYFRF